MTLAAMAIEFAVTPVEFFSLNENSHYQNPQFANEIHTLIEVISVPEIGISHVSSKCISVGTLHLKNIALTQLM